MRTKLKLLRVEKGYSQKDIAEKIGIAPTSYSLIESGIRFGTDKTWTKIKEIYGLKDEEMWGIQHQQD